MEIFSQARKFLQVLQDRNFLLCKVCRSWESKLGFFKNDSEDGFCTFRYMEIID